MWYGPRLPHMRYDFDVHHEESKCGTGGVAIDVYLLPVNELGLLLWCGEEKLAVCREGWRKILDATARVAEIVKSGVRKWSDWSSSNLSPMCKAMANPRFR